MWTEFQAGIECLTQLLLLIEGMSTEDLADAALADVAEVLQNQLIYNGEVLEIALDSLKAYKDGTQSLVYLDSSVHLAYALLRMLEKWTKVGGGREMYVRKKARRKRKTKGPSLSPLSRRAVVDDSFQVLPKRKGSQTLRKKRWRRTKRRKSRKCA